MSPRPDALGRCNGAVTAVLVAALWLAPAGVAKAASASSGGSSSPSRTVSVDLNFQINIDKFIFFRIGDGVWPTPGGTPSQVNFTLTPAIPAVPTLPTAGNNTAVNWSGGAPSFSVAATGNVLPVEVRSNAGQVSLRATVSTALTSGANVIPMSQIAIISSDSQLPAPLVPNSGTGTAVIVAGGGAGTVNSLVTLRSANWTFSYTAATTPAAGSYTGQLSFTASAP